MASSIEHTLDNAKEVEDRSGETVDPGDYQLITRSDRLEQAHQLLAICPRPGDLLLEDELAACGLQLFQLRFKRLAYGADAGVANASKRWNTFVHD